MTHRKLLRILFASLCAATGAIVACSHDEHPVAPEPPAAASSAPSLHRVAEGHTTDAGVPRGGDAGTPRPIGGGDGGIGVGSGLGSGSGPGMPVPNQPPPGAPIPNQPAPGTPPAPHR